MLDINQVQASAKDSSLISTGYPVGLAFVFYILIARTYQATSQGLSYSRNVIRVLILGSIVTCVAMQAIGDNVARGFVLRGAHAAGTSHSGGLRLKEKYELSLPGSGGSNFEASGVAWINALGRYLVVSDGRVTPTTPQLMLVDRHGAVTHVFAAGTEGLEDLESVSTDSAGNIFLMTSLSSKKRSSMVRLKNVGRGLRLASIIDVASYLSRSLRAFPNPELDHLVKNGNLRVDVEGMTIDGSSLWIGLRRPTLVSGGAILFSLEQATPTLDGKADSFSKPALMNKLTLAHSDGTILGISDIAKCGESLYLATAPTEKIGRKGAIFRLGVPLGNGYPMKVKEYSNLKPEGVACAADHSELVVVFDHGEDGSKMIFYDVLD